MTTNKAIFSNENEEFVECQFRESKSKNEETIKMTSGIIFEFPGSGKNRMRDANSRSKQSITYKHPGFKSGRMHQCESHLEEKAICIEDADSDVLEIAEQYVLLIYEINGETRKHYPDLYVRTDVRNVFKEVKTDEAANDPDIKERTELLTKLLPVYGYEYELLTESKINKEPRLSNCKFLLRHGRKCVSLADIECIRFYILKNGGLTWGEVNAHVFGQYSVAMICNMILRGYCHTDINAHWTNDTEITFSSRIILKEVI